MRYFKARIVNGVYESNKTRFKNVVSHMTDGDYLMFLIKISDKSPSEWMKFYRVIISDVSQSVGESKEDLHQMLKECLEGVVKPGDELSTKSLDTAQWQLYMDNVSGFLHKNYDYIL